MAQYLSLIVPAHNEELNIAPLVEALERTLSRINVPYEILFIDDGSHDGTFNAVKCAAARNARVGGVRFRRNFGQTTAIMAGFDLARGDVCITLDADLQHDPEYIPALLGKIQEGYDLVCTYRQRRNDSLSRRIPSAIANWLARRLSSVPLRDFGSTYRAYVREVVREAPIYGEMHRFVPVFVNMLSERITEIPIKVRPRLHGRSKYGLGRTLRVLSDLVVLLFFSKFFNRPIHIFGYISFLLGIPGFVLLGTLAARKLIWGIPIMQYGPLFILGVLLCLIAGQLFTTGIVCEYLVRVFYRPGTRKPYSICETVSAAG